MKTSFRYLTLAALLLLILFAGCRSSEQPKPSPQGQAEASAKATQSPLQMTLETDPAKVVEEKQFTFRVRVTDQAGNPVQDAALHGALTMTLMDHGKQEMDFVHKSAGIYEASAKAEMAGGWELNVTAKRGAETTTKNFPLRVDE